MGITTTSNAQQGQSLGTKDSCWECGAHANVFMVHPGYGYGVCPKCAEDIGLFAPVEDADDDIGTITKAKKRGKKA